MTGSHLEGMRFTLATVTSLTFDRSDEQMNMLESSLTSMETDTDPALTGLAWVSACQLAHYLLLAYCKATDKHPSNVLQDLALRIEAAVD